MAGLLEPGQHVPHLHAEGHPQAEKSNEKLFKATQIREVAVKQQWYTKNYKWQLINRICRLEETNTHCLYCSEMFSRQQEG